MSDLFGWLFSNPGFMPHGHCFLWQPATLWLNVGSDGLIAAAYFAIPFSLYYLVRERRSEIPYPGILLMFAAFIFLCGSTHLMEIWTVWNPTYRLAGALKAATGLISVTTMLALFRVIPKALLLQGPAQLQREVDFRTAELARVNEQLRDEIQARDRAQQQLRDQDRRKDEFLATLAHELRNPLAPIRNAATLLGMERLTTEQSRWARTVIERQARRMALLLDDLLDVSRISRGRIELKKQRVSLQSILDSAVETARPVIEERRHALSATPLPEPIDIQADALRLSQAISNLLLNAAKYTPRGGKIAISVDRAPTELAVRIRDTGVGFSAGNAAKLFEMFAQVNSSAEGARDGLGIGLSLAKGMVELHGGTIHAHSAGIDQGSEFTILLPNAMILPPAEPVPGETSDAPAPSHAATLLIADDNRDAADSLGVLLEMEGYQVVVTHSGNEALELGQKHRPSIFILDIGMPDMTGYEVARSIRQSDWGRSALLIALTGWGQNHDREKALQAGFDRHLTKPIDPAELAAVLAQLLLDGNRR